MPSLLVAGLLLAAIPAPPEAAAVPPVIRPCLSRQAAVLAGVAARPAPGPVQPVRTAQTPSRQSWAGRHPVLIGALLGSVAGAVTVGVAVDPEASPIGFFGGAAAGALAGWILGR